MPPKPRPHSRFRLGYSAVTTFRESLSLLGERRFGTFWFASLVSNIGTWAQQIAEPWLLLTLGASPVLIGLDSFALNAPVWLLTLLGGALADHADRRRVIALFQSLQMLCPMAIVVLLRMHRLQPWMIIALSAGVGITDALSMPAFLSIVPSIVARAKIGRGLALNSTQFNLSRILGPSIAGVLMSSIGAIACFAVSAVSYIPFIAVALWVLPRRKPAPLRSAAPPPARHPHHPFAGFVAILRQRDPRTALLSVFATGALCAPLVTFTPVLVRDGFHGGASSFSIAVASFGLGGLLGALGLLSVAATVDRRRLTTGFALASGVLLVLIALTRSFWVLPPLIALAGAGLTICTITANSFLETTASDRALGQTVSLYLLAVRGGISLGAVTTGLGVLAFGVQHALLLDGILGVVVQVALLRTWSRALPPVLDAPLASPVSAPSA